MQFLGLQLQQQLRKGETTTMMICLMLTSSGLMTHLILQRAPKFSAAVPPISLAMQRSSTPKRTCSLQFLTLTQSWPVCIFVRRAACVCSVDDKVLVLLRGRKRRHDMHAASVIHVRVRMSACCFLCC
jgi:hypothetical protein